jgi:hypothetical protein
MEEFVLQLLLVFIELFGEVLFEIVGEALLDLAQRVMAEVFETSRSIRPEFASLGYALLGVLAGGLSVLILPHPLVRPSKIHGISLLVSPLVTGLVMFLIGSMLRRQGKKVVQIESFGYGFAFALGMALVRYFFVV